MKKNPKDQPCGLANCYTSPNNFPVCLLEKTQVDPHISNPCCSRVSHVSNDGDNNNNDNNNNGIY